MNCPFIEIHYQPEAYIPVTGTYIEKDLSINEEIEKLRLSTTSSLLSGRRDIIVVASVSCLYGIGNPIEFQKNVISLKTNQIISRTSLLHKLVQSLYSRTEGDFFNGNFRITGRVDDVVIVSGHNLGTAPIEDAINLHENVVESAVVGYPHDIKGNALRAFVILLNDKPDLDMQKEIKDLISKTIGPIAKPDIIQIVPGLPKTRSGKIMRRILRKIASGEKENFGDISTLLNPEIVDQILLNS